MTEVQKFYKNKIVFITGGTGILGKLLVEKLLRCCPDVRSIILTIRPKRKASTEKRISGFFDDRLFDRIRNENPSVMNKVEFLKANLTEKNFGCSSIKLEILKSTVNIIFHSAATVNFNAPLSEAINSNIRITKNIIDLAKEMKQLEAFIYVSTNYSHSIMEYTEEKVYNLSYKPDFLLNLVNNVDEITLSNMTPILLNKWPTTYLMTKNVSECLVSEEKDNFPIAIFRPAAVVPTYREPIPAWVNNLQATTLIALGLATGTIKVLLLDDKYVLHMVPADLVVNCLIAIAWNTARQNGTKELKVYNFNPKRNNYTNKMFCDGFAYTKYPLECTIWKPGYITTSSKWLFNIYYFLCHGIPAIFADMYQVAVGKKPFFKRFVEKNKIMLEMCSFVLLKDLKFEFKNVPDLWGTLQPEDKEMFNFDLDSVNWQEFLETWTKETKTLLKEDLKNIKKCEAKRFKLQVAHYGLLSVVLFLGFWFLIMFVDLIIKVC